MLAAVCPSASICFPVPDFAIVDYDNESATHELLRHVNLTVEAIQHSSLHSVAMLCPVVYGPFVIVDFRLKVPKIAILQNLLGLPEIELTPMCP